ncbi:MAG: RNase III inhibitor [Ruminococcaceae bacterium]|nr:RNase III inhibitor [Oscillospiraceae bacterium]
MPLQIIRQDITKMQVDAIVNTTNEEMTGYSGVDLAVHNGAGKRLDRACKKLRPLGLGTAKLTKGYNLPAKYIIHTSGPVWQGGLHGESIMLKSCYIESLKLAVEHNFSSVAFPLISSGAYGYPKDKVLKFAIQVITEFLFEHELMVYLCVFDRASYEFSKTLFSEISDYIYDDYSEVPLEKCSFYALMLNTPKPLYDAEVQEFSASSMTAPCLADYCGVKEKSLHEYMKSMDKSFAYKLFELIDASGMTDVECYKKANIDKKTFSKIKCNPDTYKPSKQTAVAFAIALRLDFDETQDLLASAGLTLSRSFTFDKIIQYFILKGIYDIYEINEALFEFDQVLLGC